MENYVYNGTFSGNILIVGRTECGKTTFMQKLTLNNFFGNLKKAEWVSGIRLCKKEKLKLKQIFLAKLNFITRLMKRNLVISLKNLN